MKYKTIKRAKWWCDGCDGAIVPVGKKCPRCGKKNRQIGNVGKTKGDIDKSKKIWYNLSKEKE